MLVLTRKIGQTIILTLEDGREIDLVLLGLSGMEGNGNTVPNALVGIQADKSIKIMRKEIMNRPRNEQNYNSLERSSEN